MKKYNKSYIGKHCNLYYHEPITQWDEAIPLGNSHIGCLLWGGGDTLRFSLDRADLWDKTGAPEIYAKDFKYSKLIELVEKKDYDSVESKFDEFYFRPTPTKIPAGKIVLKFSKSSSNFEGVLDIKKAMAEVKLNYGAKSTVVKSYIHAQRNIGYIQINSNEEFPDVEIKAPEFGIFDDTEGNELPSVKKSISSGSLKQLKYPPTVWGEKEELRRFTQKTTEDFEYSIILGKRTNGNIMLITFMVAANVDKEVGWLEEAKYLITNALDKGFDTSFLEHKKWWEKFWAKSSITLPDKEFEKQWYLTNYFFGSCSRKHCYPMPLQGVWTADNGELPPWKGDFHHDLNTQMSYWHYCKANHMEEGESFVDFLIKTAPQARKFAKDFFDAPGLCLPSVMSIDGKALGGWAMYSLNLTNQAWLCQAFKEHWLNTGDLDFLKEKAYPYLKESALCIQRWLKPNKEGKLVLPLSSSPEIHDNYPQAWLTPNSNYDLSLLIYLFQSLKEMAEVLGSEDIKIWDAVLERLPGLAINEKNVLMLCPDESLKESQRHLAHVMSIYPLKLFDYNNGGRDKEIIDASIKDLEILGTGLWVGYSFPWMATLYAIQGNGEGARYQLKLFWENFCSVNGFHLNGDYKKRGISSFHYRPFTLEGNMAAANALQEMLVNTDKGVIRLFNAIPEEWKKEGAAFSNFRGQNGILISASIKCGKVERVTLKAQQKGNYKLQNSFSSKSLVISRISGDESLECDKGEIINIILNKDETITISLALPKTL